MHNGDDHKLPEIHLSQHSQSYDDSLRMVILRLASEESYQDVK
jgi:hypothetical protein